MNNCQPLCIELYSVNAHHPGFCVIRESQPQVTMRIPAEDNVPHRFELFLLGEGEKKVVETADTRRFTSVSSFRSLVYSAGNTEVLIGIPSSSLFVFVKEDHTLGNLLRSRLLQSPHVTFSGYRVPHPLFR